MQLSTSHNQAGLLMRSQLINDDISPLAFNSAPGAPTDREKINNDFPPFSRVFVVCSKTHKEEEIREAFQMYGNMEDVWMVKDRMTKENKGICYVKYEKASSAALAIESLDGRTIGIEPKPIKVRTCIYRVFYMVRVCLCV